MLGYISLPASWTACISPVVPPPSLYAQAVSPGPVRWHLQSGDSSGPAHPPVPGLDPIV